MKKLLAVVLALSLLGACAEGGAGNTGAAAPADTAPADDMPQDGTDAADAAAGGEFAVTDVAVEESDSIDDNYRVFYEIFVGSFSDSNGDGTGDLQGIIGRLDYLNNGSDDGLSLGIEGIWLSPILASRSYHKYDVDDYYAVDPAFGTEDDLKALVDACHERGIKVIMDMVLNHTGTGNPWFTAFAAAHQNSDTADPYYDFYTWCAGADAVPGGRAFAPLPGCDDYYECNFSTEMPELNYDNEAVREAVVEVARHYLDLGVDGFRFDAAKYIYFGDDERSGDFWVWYIDQLKAIKPDIYTVAEVWDADSITFNYFPALNCFDFTTSQPNGFIASTAQGGSVDAYTAYVDSYLDEIHARNKDAMMVPFIANHDTDRAAGYLTAASGQAQMAANLYLLSPGSPFIYYGEEIGLRGSRGGASTDANRRLKMEWGDGDTIADPEGSTYAADKRVSATVQEQLPDAGSLYNHYKRAILLRKANPAIARGDYTPLELAGAGVGGFMSVYGDDTVAVIHNTGDEAVTVDLAAAGTSFTTVNGAVGLGDASLDGTALTLDGKTSVVLGQ